MIIHRYVYFSFVYFVYVSMYIIHTCVYIYICTYIYILLYIYVYVYMDTLCTCIYIYYRIIGMLGYTAGKKIRTCGTFHALTQAKS